MTKLVCAVIVTYNRLEVLKQALRCIERQTIQPACVVIADNNSTDGTREYLATINAKGNIHCLLLEKNIGYAGGLAHGINYGLTLKQFDYFWMMDDDSFHADNTLADLLQSIQQNDCDIIGSAGFNMKYGVKQKLTARTTLQHADVVLVDGALVKAAVVAKVGAPDEKFFMMCEDYEYCKRMRKEGFKIGLLQIPSTNRLYMGGGGTFTKATLWRGYYHSRNHMLILKQYFSFSSLIGYCITQTKFLLAAAVLAPDRFQRVRFRLKGIWHGLRGVEGKSLDPATLQFQLNK
ncbi:glycosyltransferase [Ilyomonas limi]|uniref:Glycosyltransferase n=1 Tax=Ilyomonas limi TaxID=2575867 RepID=A0A4U3KTH8_9BACT|nr:glycosyltransferase [Ilyomonas limi]TKK65029.1 glycosyltransferase [Ilyomonas limi]